MEKWMTREQRKRLPKAMLFHVEWAPHVITTRKRQMITKHRLANAMRLRVGSVVFNWRLPWLEHSARTLHPEVFA